MGVYLPIKNLNQRSINRSANLVNKIEPPKSISNPSPSSCSLKNYLNFVYDQGSLGSCTANAFCAAYRIMCNVNNINKGFIPSRLYFYYHERLLEGTVLTDSGADVIDGTRYTEAYGICSETDWPYNISKFAVRPPAICDINAKKYRITSYNTIKIDNNLINNIKYYITKNQPVLIALLVYSSFESQLVAKTGLVPIPDTKKEKCLGGHELCLIGYDDTKKLFTVLNSWSANWGDRGLCYIPYNYISDPHLGLEFTIFSVVKN